MQVARANLERAGQSKKVEILVGPAVESLSKLSNDPPYDLVFIDADKESTLAYFLEAKRLLRKGGVVVGSLVFLAISRIDNVPHCVSDR